MLKGKATYYTVNDCPIWQFLILGKSSPFEWFSASCTKGENTTEKSKLIKVTGTKGTVKWFSLDFVTCEVVEVEK